MSQHPPEPSGSHPYQPPQQGAVPSRPDEVGRAADAVPGAQQETPHQPYDQQVPDGYPAPSPDGQDPGPGPQGWAPYGYEPPASGPQGPGQQGYGPQAYAPPTNAGPPLPPLSARDESLWAVLAHLSIPFFGFVGPLAVYLVYRDRSPWLRESAVEALNFSLVYTVAQAVGSVLLAALIGAVLMPLVFLAGLVLCILAALSASRHEPYRYPVTVRLVS